MPIQKHILLFAFLSALTLPAAADTTWVAPGNVSGVWTVEGSPYIVNQGDILVPNGQTLEIGPGVEVLFGAARQLEVQGCLQAIGAEGDSILFSRLEYGEYWNNIYFNYAADSSTMQYCIVERASGVQYILGMGIRIYYTDMQFKHCTIRWNYSYVTGAAIAAYYSDIQMDFCLFYNNCSWEGNVGGLDVYMGDCTLANCDFIWNSSWYDGGGLSIGGSGNHILEKCSFLENNAVGTGAGVYLSGTSVMIGNSTFVGNYTDHASHIASSVSSSTIYNCIFTDALGDADEGIYIVGGSTDIRYCCFYNNGENITGNVPSRFEELTTVNANGDSCDIYNNIFLPPELVDPGSYAFNIDLLPTSPCIDAGDPNLSTDPDGTIGDIGKAYYDQAPEMLDLTITPMGNDISLNWNSIPGAVEYTVYKAYYPYFELSTAQHFVRTDTFFVDSDAISEGKSFYKVTIVTE